MIARGFKPVGWVAAVASAAIGCYMLSLNVAAERAELASLERQIVVAKRDIRSLQTELGTRGRLQQLEHWNADVLALSAPASGQFLQDEFTLARYTPTEKSFEESAKVHMASADSVVTQPQPRAAVARDFDEDAGADLGKPTVRRASLMTGELAPLPAPRKAEPKSVLAKAAAPKASPAKAATSNPPLTKAALTKAAKAVAAKAPAARPVLAKAVAPKPVPIKAGAVRPLAARPPVKKTGLSGGLAKEIAQAAKAEKTGGGAAGR